MTKSHFITETEQIVAIKIFFKNLQRKKKAKSHLITEIEQSLDQITILEKKFARKKV